MSTIAPRKYALTRISAGDYLLPSNDGCTLWRIAKEEDGDWVLWVWPDPGMPWSGVDDMTEWSHWEHRESYHATRAEAIDRAMEMS